MSWRTSRILQGAVEELHDGDGRGPVLEHREPDDPPGEVVDHDGDPEAEWPSLREGPREPGDPEPTDDGHGREISVPDLVGALRRHDASRGRDDGRRSLAVALLGEHPPNGRRPEVEAGSAEHPGDLPGAHRGAERLQPADDVRNEVGETVYGFGESHERVGSLVVESVHPGRDGERGDEEPSSGLSQRPTSGGAQFEDREPVGRGVMRSALGGDTLHPDVLDSQLLLKQRDLAPESIVLGLEPDTGVEVVLGAAAGHGEDDVGQRDRLNRGRADAAGPTSREAVPRRGMDTSHGRLRSLHRRRNRAALGVRRSCLLPERRCVFGVGERIQW